MVGLGGEQNLLEAKRGEGLSEPPQTPPAYRPDFNKGLQGVNLPKLNCLGPGLFLSWNDCISAIRLSVVEAGRGAASFFSSNEEKIGDVVIIINLLYAL